MSRPFVRKPTIRVSPNHRPPQEGRPVTLQQLRDLAKVLMLVQQNFPLPSLRTPYMALAWEHELVELNPAGPTNTRVNNKGEAFIEVFNTLKRGDRQRNACLLLGFNIEE